MPVGSLGLIVGLVLGFALIVGNFGDMLIVALFGVLGYGIHKIVIGDLDLSRLTGNRRDR